MQQTPESEPDLGMTVDCGSCAMRGTEACEDCVVTFVLDRAQEAVVFDAAEERAIRAMSKAGLLPLLRWQKRTG